MTHFVALDADGIAIHGIGATEEEARADALALCGPMFASDGAQLTDADALATFTVRPATAALVALVQDSGGLVAYGTMPDGETLGTEEEAEGRARLLAIKAGCESNGVDICDLIRERHNCAVADMDAEGDVWVQGPMLGHWLTAAERHALADWIEAQGDPAPPAEAEEVSQDDLEAAAAMHDGIVGNLAHHDPSLVEMAACYHCGLRGRMDDVGIVEGFRPTYCRDCGEPISHDGFVAPDDEEEDA